MRHEVARRVIRATAIVAVLATVPLLQRAHISHNAGGGVIASEVLFAWYLDTFCKHIGKAWFWSLALLLFSSHCMLLWRVLERALPATASIGYVRWAVLVVAEAAVFHAITVYVKRAAREQALERRRDSRQ